MIHRMPITKARINLGQLARRVHVNREYFILEKDGIPVIGLMSADELEDYLESIDGTVRSHIQKSRKEYMEGKALPAERLLAHARKGRRGARRRKAA